MFSFRSRALIRPLIPFIITSCFSNISLSLAMASSGIFWPKVVLFGDSITQFSFDNGGWGSSLSSQLQRRCDVINRGISGYNSRWANIILPQIITKDVASDVAIVTIFFGANDAALLDKNPQQHIPLDEYQHNLQTMVDYLISIGIMREQIIMIGPPPLDEVEWEKACIIKETVLNRNNEVTGEYSQALCKVAEKYNIDCIELWTDMQKDKNWRSFLSDGLHLSQEGSQFLDNKLSPIVLKKTSHIPLQYPYWNDVNAENPQLSLNNYKPAKVEL